MIAWLLLAGGAIFYCHSQTARAEGEGAGFSFAAVCESARSLAARDFQPVQNTDLPEAMKKLTYDEYQMIRYRPEHNLWKDDHMRFEVQFIPRGYLYQDPVKIHILDGRRVSDVVCSPEDFDYGATRASQDPPASVQVAGFRLLYPLNSPQKLDEVAEFLGASYFRVLGAAQRYGTSLRGLAVDTAQPAGEEFPRFTEFWLEKPPPLAGGMRLYALLNGPSVAGAYHFTIEPGAPTKVQVEASLFFRKSPQKVGLAPLGSLYLTGQNRTRFVPDYRPQVHDADGLQIESGDGDWIWRPLVNPARTFWITRFPITELKGFGLMQRDRQFSDYDDLQSRFELRPCYWIEPGAGWEAGAVELVEIPTSNDYNDNIVAYWTPRERPGPSNEVLLTYRISALSEGPDHASLLRARSTHIQPETGDKPPRFVIDFTGTPPRPFNPESAGAVKVQASQGQVRNLVLRTNDANGGWQVFFDLAGAGDNRSQVKLRLQAGGEPVSETWVYDYQKSN